MNEPLISVIMPSYNSESYIREAIDSALSQTYKRFELIVIDDCSDDSTPDIVREYCERDERVHFLANEKNLGAAGTRNRGLDEAKGDYIAFLDSDDIWRSDKLAKQLQLLSSSGKSLCYSSYAFINESGEKCGPDYTVPSSTDFERLLRENCISSSTVLLSREALGAHRFHAEYMHEDYVLWLDLLREGCACIGDSEVLADYRLHTGSKSANKLISAWNRWKVYRNYLKLPFFTSLGCLSVYAVNGFRKYSKRH